MAALTRARAGAAKRVPCDTGEQLYAVVREDPFDPRPPQLVEVRPGETLDRLVDRLGLDPIARGLAVAVIDGEEVPEADWGTLRVRSGQHVAICVAPQGGGDDSNKLLTTVLTIFVMVAAFWVSGGALAGVLGAGFAEGSAGAYLGAAAVSAVGQLGISALVKPPSAPAQDKINPVYAIDGATNQFQPYEPILLSVGRRRVFPRQVARGFQEIVGDDFYYRLVVEWGPIGVALSDIKVGDTPISEFDGVQMQHRLVSSDPVPDLYPAEVFQEAVGATLSSLADWESRRTIADATQATVIIGFPTGLGHTSKKGKSEQWASQVEIRYRTVTGSPGSEVYGSWQSPPGNSVNFPTRGGVVPGAGKYGFSEKKRNQPFFRAVTIALPAAGTYDVEVRRSSYDSDPDIDRTVDDMVWSVMESRRPGLPVTRDDVAWSVFRFKGTDETQGRVNTINAIVDRLIPRFSDTFLDTGDLSTATAASLTGATLSSCPWEIILWAYRNGFEGREPLGDAAIDWPSFAIAAKDRKDNGWSFDHVFDRAATIEEVVETIGFAGCGRAAFIGNKLTAVVDAPQAAPVAVISDRKARNVKAVKRLIRPPHGFRLQFDDAADGYRTREIIVYTGGYTAATATRFETLKIPGVVHWDAVHRLAERNYRNSQLQNRTITAEMPVASVDTSWRLGRWIGIQTKVVEVGRASGWIRAVQTDGSGDVTGVTLDQPVEQTTGDSLVLQWSRQAGVGVAETLSNALPLAAIGTDTVSEQISFATPVTGGDKPQVGDAYVYGVAGYVRLDGLIDGIEAIDEDWLRFSLVNYAPARFDETGFVVPAYTPAFERPAFIQAPDLELVSVGQNHDQTVIHFRPVPAARGEIAYLIASRAIAPDSGDTATGVWEALPDLAATERQLSVGAGQAGDTWQYRIAAVAPGGDVGAWLYVDPVAALATVDAPANVSAVPAVESGAGGSARPILVVVADVNEAVQVETFVIDLRGVATSSGERLPEDQQPDFQTVATVAADKAYAVLRGLPSGARLDVEVYFRGARQETSARVRIEDVTLPTVDTAGNIDWSNVSGSDKPEDGATRSRVVRSATAPASPTVNDIWVVLSGGVAVAIKVYDGSSWGVSADLTAVNVALAVVDQGDLATLDQVTWATQVTGTGRPEDYATKSRVYRSATTPASPNTNDIWVVLDGSGNPTSIKAWNGSAWILGADLTALNVAFGVVDQDWGATASQDEADNTRAPIGGNRLMHTEFSKTDTLWTALGTTGSNASFTRAAASGVNYLRYSRDGMTAESYLYITSNPQRQRFTVKPNEVVFAAAYATAAICSSMSLIITFRDDTGAATGYATVDVETDSINYPIENLSKRLSGAALAPAGTTNADMQVRGVSSGGNSIVKMARPQMCLVASVDAAPPKYVQGSEADWGADITENHTAMAVQNQGLLALADAGRGNTASRPAAAGSWSIYSNTEEGYLQMDVPSEGWVNIATISVAAPVGLSASASGGFYSGPAGTGKLTGDMTCTVSNASGAVTYLWTSSDPAVSFTAPTAATTKAQRDVDGDEQAVVRCLVTDTSGSVEAPTKARWIIV